jgi:hypothetical protein
MDKSPYGQEETLRKKKMEMVGEAPSGVRFFLLREP